MERYPADRVGDYDALIEVIDWEPMLIEPISKQIYSAFAAQPFEH